MPAFHIAWLDRDFGQPSILPDLDYRIERYSYTAIGGPDRALLTAIGSDLDLLNLIDFLRRPLAIRDSDGVVVWSGLVYEVQVKFRSYEIGFTLDNFASSVRVAYSTPSVPGITGSARGTTTAAIDAEAVAEYGTKEIIIPLNEASPANATGLRDAVLDRMKSPQPNDQFAESREVEASILCKGWWYTLEWVYHLEEKSSETFGVSPAPTTPTTQDFGTTTDNEAAQSFTVSASVDFWARDVYVQLAKIGSPTDNVILSVRQDNAGDPGTVIQTKSLTGSTLTDTTPLFERFELTEVAGLLLSNGGTYWISVERDGALDNTNYYLIGVDEGLGYTGGVFRVSPDAGSTWNARSTDADAMFDVRGERATEIQIGMTLDGTAGQFFTGYDIVATGVTMPARLKADRHARNTIEELLECGTTNNKRLLVNVDQFRQVIVTEEPDTDNNLLVNDDLSIETDTGFDLPRHHLHNITGKWVTPRELWIITLSDARLINLRNRFVEWSEYNVERQELRIRTRDTSNDFDLLEFRRT
jgi:hypothetical protein